VTGQGREPFNAIVPLFLHPEHMKIASQSPHMSTPKVASQGPHMGDLKVASQSHHMGDLKTTTQCEQLITCTPRILRPKTFTK